MIQQLRAALALCAALGAGHLGAQAPSHAFFVGPSIMNDRLDDRFDHRPVALGVEAEFVLFGGPELRGGDISVTARAHTYSNASLLGDTPPYQVTSVAAGLTYHPFAAWRFDPYAGIAVRSRQRTKSQSDSSTVDPLFDAGARLRLTRRVFAQAGMSVGGIESFGLWRLAVMYKF